MYKLNVGETYMLDSSGHQYPSVLIYKVLDLFDDKALIKRIAYYGKQNPHWKNDDFDEYIVDRSFAIIVNARKLNEKKVIDLLFSRQNIWNEFNV